MLRLKKLRLAQNLSLRELSNQLNISYSSLGKYERGEQEPNIDTLKKVADYFNVSVDYLIGQSIFMNFKYETAFQTSNKSAESEVAIEIYTKLTQCIEKAEKIYGAKYDSSSWFRLDSILIKDLSHTISDYNELLDAVQKKEPSSSLYQTAIANSLSHNCLELISDAIDELETHKFLDATDE